MEAVALPPEICHQPAKLAAQWTPSAPVCPFVAGGCTDVFPGVTAGAGVQFFEAFEFAEANNIMRVGGSDATISLVGGFLQCSRLRSGSGPTAQRCLEFKVVMPDGVYRSQNKDLFFALHGGGGGTFGIMLEATVLAAPVQVVVVTWARKDPARAPRRSPRQRRGRRIYGAFNCARGKDETGGRGGRDGGGDGVPSFLPFFVFMTDAGGNAGVEKVGYNVSLASQLVPRASFAFEASRAELITAPTAAGPADVTPAWRDTVYHVTTIGMWRWNATAADVRGVYDRTSKLMDYVTVVTLDAAYFNEADVHEPNFEVSFWGEHDPELVAIKMRYDPDRLLDCWHCPGWDRDSERYGCFL
ncbi:hypothetical protein FB451DRAFT_1412323 [Mycena latifolia]|nr:hypothetical protein FB451DRAFT_1412323 [Mycena latifolia]